MEQIILFDGNCLLCNRSVRFISKRDPLKKFRFVANGSDEGKNILHSFHFADAPSSLILLSNNTTYRRSAAVLKIAIQLAGPVKLMGLGYLLPRFFRDAVYDFIARNRYAWFGHESCSFPPVTDSKHRKDEK
jgi:predicted DCC family thiol-disulfide oxidoreductase YuxK